MTVISLSPLLGRTITGPVGVRGALAFRSPITADLDLPDSGLLEPHNRKRPSGEEGRILGLLQGGEMCNSQLRKRDFAWEWEIYSDCLRWLPAKLVADWRITGAFQPPASDLLAGAATNFDIGEQVAFIVTGLFREFEDASHPGPAEAAQASP